MRSFSALSIALSTLLFSGAVEALDSVANTHVHRNPRADLRMSNAKRLASGRPLRRPKQIRAAQILGNSDITANELPVANVPDCRNGFIRVEDDSSVVLGYLAAPLDGIGVFSTLVQSTEDPNILTICEYIPDPNSGFSDILDTGSPVNSTVSYIGGIEGDEYAPNLGSTHGDYAYIGLVARTPAGSDPVADPDSTGNSHNEVTGRTQAYESNVWYSNGVGQYSITWTDNMPGTASKTLSLARLSNDEFIASNDLASLRANGVPASDVAFFLERS